MMTYEDQLKSDEWRKKRNNILQRDNYHCQHCKRFGICGDDIYIPLYTLDDIKYYITNKELQELIFDSFFNLSCISGTYDQYGRPIVDEKKFNLEKALFSHSTTKYKDTIYKTNFNISAINSSDWLQKHPFWSNPLLHKQGETILNQIDDYILYSTNISLPKYINGRKILINPYTSICSYEIQHKEKSSYGFLKITTAAIHILFMNAHIDDNYTEGSTYFYTNLYKQEYEIPILNIHHKSYMKNHLAWEYENSNFITLCKNCHQKEHNQNNLPIKRNEEVTISHKYLTFFLSNIDFAQIYLSIHYPFSYQFLVENWSFFILGDAHYSVSIVDTDTIYHPKLGLVFNKNIRWNSKLRAKFNYGLWDPFLGLFVGTGHGQTEYNEIDFEDTMIPLDIKEEFEARDSCLLQMNYLWQQDSEFTPTFYSDYDLFEEIPTLTFEEFKNKYDKFPLKVLVNDSIWENTLKDIIDEKFCLTIFNKLKYKKTQNYVS